MPKRNVIMKKFSYLAAMLTIYKLSKVICLNINL